MKNIQKLMCKLGIHRWRDMEETIDSNGSFIIEQCIRCNKRKKYEIYTLRGEIKRQKIHKY